MECYPHGATITNDGIFTQSEKKHEVVLVVKFNNSEALILKDPIELTYYKFGSDTIIATDGVFYNFYGYERPTHSQAFGGRKFTLTMHDGEVIECNGQWWSAMTQTARMLIDQPLIDGTANDLKRLQECYVFSGHSADKQKWQELRKTYTGPVYEYYDGEFIIYSLKKQHGKLIKLFRDYRGGLCAIDEHHDHYEIKTIHGKLYFRYRSHIKSDDWYNEIFTKGRKDFSIKEPRKPVEYHICKICKSTDATIPYGDGEYYCHLCDKVMTEEDNRQNYYYGI